MSTSTDNDWPSNVLTLHYSETDLCQKIRTLKPIENSDGESFMSNCFPQNISPLKPEVIQKISNNLTTLLPSELENSFDDVLVYLWDKKQDEGDVFRYKYRHLPTKIVGKYQFLLQLNTERAEKRRKPQDIRSLRQPFDDNQFNFTKVKSKEILMRIKPSWEKGDHHHLVIVNVSPLAVGHVLITPNVNYRLPQLITVEGLRLAVDIMLLSSSVDFRVGFNSLGGYASVNHQHFHGYYINHRLPVEHLVLKKLSEAMELKKVSKTEIESTCFKIEDYPANGFVFQGLFNCFDGRKLIQNVMSLLNHLVEKNIAHNIFMTKGSSLWQKCHFDSIRIYVWPRTSVYGRKDEFAFYPALCELAGHFPVKNQETFEGITASYMESVLKDITREEWCQVEQNLNEIFI